MNIIMPIIGALIGGAIFEFAGAVTGIVVGWLTGTLLGLQRRLTAVEQKLGLLQRVRPEVTATPTRPALAPAAPPPATTIAEPALTDEFIFELEDEYGYAPQPTIGQPVRPKPAPERRPPAPAQPAGSWLDDLPSPLQNLLTGGNLLVKVGVVILFFGVSFLVKYAAQRGLLPVQLRLMAAAAGGITLLLVGWRLREQRREYALALQGGGIGILAITTFAAFRICQLLPAPEAFGLLALVAMLCAALAVAQNARTLALFGLAGGFLAPLLTGVGTGTPALLFGYYAVLNLGLAAIAWFRSWRELNLAGFIATFIAGLYWGGSFYRPEHFAMVEPFLVFFFLLYLALATLFALRQPPELRGSIDGTLVFGTPIAAFVLQAALVTDTEYGLAWSALVAGLIYLALFGLLRRRDATLRPLANAYLAFGALFVTLSAPLACDGRWTSAIWALEGAGVAWATLRQGRQVAGLFGIALQLAAGIAFVSDLAQPSGPLPLANALYLGTLLLCLAGLVTAHTLRRHPLPCFTRGTQLQDVMTAWGLLWWFAGGLHEIGRFIAPELRDCILLLFITVSCWGWHWVGRRLQWQALGLPALLLVPSLALFVPVTGQVHPLANGGWLAWPVALVSAWLLLRQRETDVPETLQAWLHAGAIWLCAWLATWELGWQVQHHLAGKGNWQLIALVTPALLLLGLVVNFSRCDCWPFDRHQSDYLGLAALPLVAGCWGWVLLASAWPGAAWPFPWLPLLNPLDLITLATLVGLWRWWERARSLPALAVPLATASAPLRLIAGATLLLWVNTLLARTMHHWGDVPYTLTGLFHSFLAQTCFAIFWTLLALAAMFAAGQRASRQLWLIGAGLLGLVVVKLFTVDLAGHGTVERIVSFVAVGLLLLVIGWFAPVPPETTQHQQEVLP